MVYENRIDGGRQLAEKLRAYRDQPDVIVLALPRGGVPVGYEVAQALHVPLDVFLVRKLGVPGHEELAMGAIASGSIRVLNDDVLRMLPISNRVIESITREEEQELQRREREYRYGRPAPQLRGKTIILVDDGLATGSTMRAAIKALRQQGPARIVVAVPVGAAETCADIAKEADEVICAQARDPFYAVGYWYASFEPTTDEEVREILARAGGRMPIPSGS